MAHAFTFDYLPSEDLMELQPGLQDPACPAQPSRIPAYLASFDEARANVVCADSAATVKNALAAADAGSEALFEYLANYGTGAFEWHRAHLRAASDQDGVRHVVGYVDNIQDERALRWKAEHDSMTGLVNHATAERLVNHALADPEVRRSSVCAIIDIDDFKQVNDRYGHGRGDEALRICAAKMRAALGGADLYRIGGDEFVALAVDVEEDVFVAMVDRLEQTLKVEEGEAGLFGSVGARWSPDCSSVEALLTAADQDMYEKKRSFHAERALANALPYEDADRLGREALEDDIVRARESALLREYNMLMSALHVSVSKHLFTERFEVVWANDYYYAMTGYTREEYEDLFDNCCAAYFASEPDEYTALSKAVVEAYEAGEPGYELLMHMPCKGGVYTWIRVVGMFTNEIIDGAPVIYATFVNVDDVVQMERERSITYDNIPGFVARYRVARDGLMLLYGNKRFVDFFGPIGDVSSNSLLQENLQINDAVIGAQYERMRNGEPVSFDAEALSVQGNRAAFKIYAECVNRIEGDPVYLVLYLDMTEIVEQRHLTERAMAQLRELAYVDPVTGGRNRVSFESDATSVLKSASEGAYAFVSLDVDKFKVINDQFGLEQGDAVLKVLYDSIAGQLDAGEFVGRISADLFNLLLKTLPSASKRDSRR